MNIELYEETNEKDSGEPQFLSQTGRFRARRTRRRRFHPTTRRRRPADDSPVQSELVHNAARPIYTIEQLNREQQRLDCTRENLLTKYRGALLVIVAIISRAAIALSNVPRTPPIEAAPQSNGNSSKFEEIMLRELFDRWEKVWHEGQHDLVPQCVQPNYIRHDELGDRVVTREAYASEIAKLQKDRPDVRIVVYDHTFEGERAWFRFTMKWTDLKTGQRHTRAGMQVYRIADGKLAETWVMYQPLESAWTDAVAQDRWTSAPPIK